MTEATALSRIEADIAALPPEERERLEREVLAATQGQKWIPSPGPQTDAYYSEADVLLYGGEPGGGKSDLILGLAFNEHERSLIMRRQYTDLGGIIDRMLKIHGSKQGYNGSPPPSLKTESKSIELGAAQKVGDEMSWMGRARDLLGLDEATQFAEQQVRFLMGWVRSTTPGQRCRTVLATNPPLTSEGLWVIKMFAPWLDATFPRPAKPGELRWVITDAAGNDQWVDGPQPVETTVNGVRQMVNPTSRTYIPSSVNDNPFLRDSGYKDTLAALPEPYRSLLMGGFAVSFEDADDQVIPTAWVKASQLLWTKNPPEDVPMCAIGVDASGGGKDPLVLAPRYDGWFAPIHVVDGKKIPMEEAGSFTAGVVVTKRRDAAVVIVDMSGGYGGPCYEHLHRNEIDVRPFKGAEKTTRRTKDKQLAFYNRRSEALWRLREALDPDQPGGQQIMLPPDAELVADLTAPRLDLSWNGIKVESKEDIKKRLGRSTNKGDAVMMSWYDGPKAATHLDQWDRGGRRPMGRMPQVVMHKPKRGR